MNLTPAPNIGEIWAEYLDTLTQYARSESALLLCAILKQTREWDGLVEKPQLWQIHLALSRLLPMFPIHALTALWNRLDNADPLQRIGMDYGLEILTAEHAVQHLLVGLETCKSHNARLKIVEALEIIGDVRTLPILAKLHRQAGTEDWVLGRNIARAFRAIHFRAKEEDAITLLRASSIPATELLHVMSAPEYDVTDLLHIPREEPGTDGNDS